MSSYNGVCWSKFAVREHFKAKHGVNKSRTLAGIGRGDL